MGGFFAKALQKLVSKQNIKILILGLDAAGKTTLLYKLKLGSEQPYYPDCSSFEKVEYKNITFFSWDLGGQMKIRPLWRQLFQNTKGIIFLVDSNDPERLSDYVFCNNKKINSLTFGYIRQCVDKLNLSINMPTPLISMMFEYNKWHCDYDYDVDDYDTAKKKELDYLFA
eukprot:713476_1